MADVISLKKKLKEYQDDELTGNNFSTGMSIKVAEAERDSFSKTNHGKDAVKTWIGDIEKRLAIMSGKLPYEELCECRRLAFFKFMENVKVPAAMAEFFAAMFQTHGELGVLRGRHWFSSWATGYMIIMHGEAVDKWPDEFTEYDIDRARNWQKGQDIPREILYEK